MFNIPPAVSAHLANKKTAHKPEGHYVCCAAQYTSDIGVNGAVAELFICADFYCRLLIMHNPVSPRIRLLHRKGFSDIIHWNDTGLLVFTTKSVGLSVS